MRCMSQCSSVRLIFRPGLGDLFELNKTFCVRFLRTQKVFFFL